MFSETSDRFENSDRVPSMSPTERFITLRKYNKFSGDIEFSDGGGGSIETEGFVS